MRLIPLALLLLATPAVAQPVIIPLEKQPQERPAPMAVAPPVAPPTAQPDMARNAPDDANAPQEEAYQPPAK